MAYLAALVTMSHHLTLSEPSIQKKTKQSDRMASDSRLHNTPTTVNTPTKPKLTLHRVNSQVFGELTPIDNTLPEDSYVRGPDGTTLHDSNRDAIFDNQREIPLLK
jgi:hypothetical protein